MFTQRATFFSEYILSTYLYMPHLILSLLLLDIERLRPLALSHGIDITISRCKI